MPDDKYEKNADVVCKMAGFRGGAKKYHRGSSPFGSGGSGIVLGNVGCNDDENNIFDCIHSGINSGYCSNWNWFSVTCYNWYIG